jgi:diadenosine tetraphosphatase ApaH/serine/threonine PP2A family protein phosphatase
MVLVPRSVLGLLYDVHGNLGALDAVLADARGQGVGSFVLGGDYALFGPQPRETLDRLRELDATWIRGNGERWTARPDEAPDNDVVQGAIAASREALDGDDVAELDALPVEAVLRDTLYVHGSPVSDVRSFLPTPGDDEDELLAGVSAPRLVFGHTHLPFRRVHAGTGIELVNPGSVGMPFDRDPRAAYAIVHPDRGVEHRRVPYDHEASAALVRERFDGAPWTDVVSARIAQARFDV